MRDDDMIATGLIDDRDPDGTDIYGMIPLLAFVDEDGDVDDDDTSGADDEQELPPLIEPSSIEVDVPEGAELADDDEAFQVLTARGVTDMFPGEARSLITYMRPLTEDERDTAENPYLNDLRWTDDPSHTDDVLRAGKSDRGMDNYLDDATYGDIHMKSPEEVAERLGTDKLPPFHAKRRPVKIPVKLINATVVVGLTKKLTVEHANWLAEQDKKAGVIVRPRSYYENVSKLWAKDKLKKAAIPSTSSSSGWGRHPKQFVVAADRLLKNTTTVRSRFSPMLGDQVDMGGWNPFSAAKSAIKTAVKYTVTKPLSYGYKYGKAGLKYTVAKPFEYTYKGVKYVGKMAERIALAPIRAIINKFTGKLVNRRANALAKQKGLAAPSAVERASAKNWAKNYVRAKGGKYGGAIASLMGNDPGYGVRNVDITFGGDVMGLSKTGTAGLIILGPIGLIALLTGLVNTAGPAAPAPAPGTEEASAEDAATDDGQTDPGAGDGYAAPGDAYDGSEDPGAADDGQTDSSGRSVSAPNNANPARWMRQSITLEELNSLPIKQRRKVQKLIQSGRYRLA